MVISINLTVDEWMFGYFVFSSPMGYMDSLKVHVNSNCIFNLKIMPWFSHLQEPNKLGELCFVWLFRSANFFKPRLQEPSKKGKGLIFYYLNFHPPQVKVLQDWISEDEFEQLAPPKAGAGLLQERARFWVPPPQVWEHEDHVPQVPQLPSVAKLTQLTHLLKDVKDS